MLLVIGDGFKIKLFQYGNKLEYSKMYSKKIFCIENNQYNWKNEKKYNALPVTVENSQIKKNFLQLQLPFSSF